MNRLIDSSQQFWVALTTDTAVLSELSDLLDIGTLIWQRGWAEANAGNVSLRLPDTINLSTQTEMQKMCNSNLDRDIRLGEYTWYLVSATGSRFRQFARLGFQNFCLAGVPKSNHESSEPQIIIPCDRKPTSEWISHLSIHTWLIDNLKQENVILHSHPTPWIALSNLPEYRNSPEELIADLYEFLPELKFYLPDGIAFTTYALPGSYCLAENTIANIYKSNVIIWEKHGVVIIADSVVKAFDLLEIIAKAAEVYLLLKREKLSIF